MARLNIAKSRTRRSTWSLVHIDHTFLVRSGGFEPITFPLFHGLRCEPSRPSVVGVCMVVSSVAEADQHAPFVVDRGRRSGFSALRLLAAASRKALSRILTLNRHRQPPTGQACDRSHWLDAHCLGELGR